MSKPEPYAGNRPADAEQLLLAIGKYGWPGALKWTRRQGWSEEKTRLLLEYNKREGLLNIEIEEGDVG